MRLTSSYILKCFLLFLSLTGGLMSGSGQKRIAVADSISRLIIGTYTKNGKSEGIYLYDFNTKQGTASLQSKVRITNPSFLTINQMKGNIYAVTELADKKGGVSALVYDPAQQKPLLLNSTVSGGDNPCYISKDSHHRFLFVANYSGGNFSAIRLKKDGSIDSLVQTIQHKGKSINTARQENAHVHSAVISPDEKFLLVQDLGTDQIAVYQLDLNNSNHPVTEKPVFVFNTVPGSGPRHLCFHPFKPIAYSVQELNGTVNAYVFKNGTLRLIQEISMIDSAKTDYKDKKIGAADVHVSPDGRFLYASNRGDFNQIVIYKVLADSKLQFIGTQSTLGIAPRNFGMDASGKYLLVGNQDSNEVVIFKRDIHTGLLSDSGNRIQIGMPVCILFQ